MAKPGDQEFDVIVLGGGPAGSVFAWLAARDGRRVALVDPCRVVPRTEGLSPRLRDWMQRTGLYDPQAIGAVEARRTSDWNGNATAINSELIVDRAALDHHLRDMARRAGATLIRDSGAPGPGQVQLAGQKVMHGRFIIDARGRRAGQGTRRSHRGPATIAIGAGVQLETGQGAGTWVIPLDQGWLWLARRDDGSGWVQLVLDAADPMGQSPDQRLRSGLEAAAERLPVIHSVHQDLLVRDATPVLGAPSDDLGVMAIGDAASAMDPLSGHGLFWAVSSALTATAVRRTLEQREDAETVAMARRFLRQRHEDVYPRQARLGRDFIRSQTARLHLPFWQRRAAFPDDIPIASDRITSSLARRIIVENGLLTAAEVVLTPHAPAGVAWVGTQKAADLFRAASAGRDR
ncbi:flavin-dependent monooxygenase QhpG [Paracoccus tegillarcae]|nr:NAD(P)-binding protein [Paracoccus tegillarcae]